MTKRQTKFAHDTFYNEFHMLDKYTYIKNVMASCETVEQLENSYKWGISTLWKWYDVINEKYKNKFDAFKWISIWSYIFKRTSLLGDDIKSYKNTLLNTIESEK